MIPSVLDLKKHVPKGRVSTGFLGTYQGRVVWAVSRRAYWRKTAKGTVMGLIGIGGGQEAGETLPVTLAREAMEEARSKIRIAGASTTVWAYGDGTAKVVDLRPSLGDEPGPILVWQSPLNYLDAKGRKRVIDYICAVYQGEFLDPPKPAAETPGLLHCGIEDFRAMLHEPVPMKEVIARGGAYEGRELPADTLFELHGSSLYLARHWDLLQLGGN